MRRLALITAAVLATGLAGFFVAAAAVPGTHEVSACTTASATAAGVTVPDHVIGADGLSVFTFPGVTVPGSSDVQTACATATATDSTVTGPTTTVLTTVPGTTTAPTTTTVPTTTTQPTTTTTPPPPPGPCGTQTGAPAINKVVWIWMENKDYSSIVGDTTNAPYENQLAAQCGLATNYAGVTHPSLPNYIAGTSGSTQGITDDNPPASHPLGVASIFGQVASKSYEESMPANCALTSSGTYAVKHNPEAYYTAIRTACGTNDVPMGTTSSGNFLTNLNAGSLPAFSFITPNMCNDMHDCAIKTGDDWLKSWVPKILAGPDYLAGHTAVVVVFDENSGTAGNKVYCAIASPYTPVGARSATAFTHYSLLRTTEELLGAPLLGSASSANSMKAVFFP